MLRPLSEPPPRTTAHSARAIHSGKATSMNRGRDISGASLAGTESGSARLTAAYATAASAAL